MARPDTILATLSGKAIAERAIDLSIDLARADDDLTGTWADSARRRLCEIEAEIVNLKRLMSKLPASRLSEAA